MENQNLNTARTLTKIGAIIGILAGAAWIISFIGILWGAATLIGGILLLKYNKYSDTQFVEKRTPLLIWGILFLFTTILGGILLLVAYFTSNINIRQEKEKTELSGFTNLEKAYELKEKGVLSDEEFNKIKQKSL